MLCPSTMLPKSLDLSAPTGTLPGMLVAKATYPPAWQQSWLRYIPLLGIVLEAAMNVSRYETTLEDNAEFIAQDLENSKSPWIGKSVGVISVTNIKSELIHNGNGAL